MSVRVSDPRRTTSYESDRVAVTVESACVCKSARTSVVSARAVREIVSVTE